MKFKIFILILWISCFSSCTKNENDLTKRNIHGNVRSIQESKYSAIDKFGELLKDSLRAKEILTFNQLGFLVEKVEKGFHGFDDRIERFEYKDGKISQTNSIDSNKNILQTCIYDYDKNNQLIKFRNIDKDQKILQYETYAYDTKGFLIASNSYKEDGSLTSKRTFLNDQNGNCIKTDFFEGNSIVVTHKFKYNDNNKVTEREIFIYNSMMEKNLYEYENGELIEEISYPPPYSKDTTTWKYEYKEIDEKGNWTLSILHWNQGERYEAVIIERKISYFN